MSERLKIALGRRIDGERLSQRDQRELARYDKAEVERLLGAVPRVVVRRMTGLTQGKLEGIAQRHEIPIDGAVVDMFDLLPTMLDLLEVEHTTEGSASLERLRAAKADMAELDLARKRGDLVDVRALRGDLDMLASMMRSRFEAMVRAGGAVVAREIELLVSDIEEEIRRRYPEAGVVALEHGT